MNNQNDRALNCEQVRQELPALLYGELEPEPTAAVEQHLASCPDCRAEQEAHERTAALLDRWPAPTPPLVPPLTMPSAASCRPKRDVVFRLLRPLAVGAAAAAVVFAVLALLVADAKYADGRLTITMRPASASERRASDFVLTDSAVVRVRQLARTECDQRIEELVELLGEELRELNRRQEQRQLLLAQAVDARREQDWRIQTAALQMLARGFNEDSTRHRQAILEVYDLMESSGVVPASYIEPQRKD